VLEKAKEHVIIYMSLWDTMLASTLRRYNTIDTYHCSMGNSMQRL